MANGAGLIIQVSEISAQTMRARNALDQLCRRFDLGPYIVVSRIRIASGGARAGGTLLTLDAASAADPDLLLAEFLHRQMLFRLGESPAAAEQAVGDLAAAFPELAESVAGTIPDAPQAYRILAAAALELAALTRLVGAEEAAELVRSHAALRPLYRLLLRNAAAISEILTKRGLAVPDAG